MSVGEGLQSAETYDVITFVKPPAADAGMCFLGTTVRPAAGAYCRATTIKKQSEYLKGALFVCGLLRSMLYRSYQLLLLDIEIPDFVPDHAGRYFEIACCCRYISVTALERINNHVTFK